MLRPLFLPVALMMPTPLLALVPGTAHCVGAIATSSRSASPFCVARYDRRSIAAAAATSALLPLMPAAWANTEAMLVRELCYTATELPHDALDMSFALAHSAQTTQPTNSVRLGIDMRPPLCIMLT